MSDSARRSGILAGLYSVYSRTSCGTGDFQDLCLLIDLCAATGNSVLHLLPLNEMSAAFEPFSPLSMFALDPMYASFDHFLRYPGVRTRCDSIAEEHPTGKRFFDPVMKEKKFNLLWDIYIHETQTRRLDEKALEDFRERNASWLEDFALFKVIGDYQGKKPWYEWEERYRKRDPAALAEFSREHEKELKFDFWVQMQLSDQLTRAAEHARARGVTLKGDLPLRIGRNCADVWQHQELFRLEFDSSLPPDPSFPAGRRRNAPPCDWDAMAEDGYAWMRRRLAYWGQYYRMLRIVDPEELCGSWVVPWCEPGECGAANGFYLPEGRVQQQRQALRLISVLKENTPALLSAENLGRYPGELGRLLRQRGIMGNYLHRMAKQRSGQDFLDPADYLKDSVAALSCDNCADWRSWWEREAGTVDVDLFSRACAEAGIDAARARQALTDPELSPQGRLRWKQGLHMAQLITLLGSTRRRLSALISVYQNSYGEKEKAWRQIAGNIPMEESPTPMAARKALEMVLGSSSRYAVNSIADWAYAAAGIKGDTPVSLDELNTPATVGLINEMVRSSGR